MLRSAWLLILCLLASSLLTTATLCAQEGYAAPETSCGGTAHVEGDADQVPADSDQPFPHHHGTCHGHSLGAPVASAALLPGLIARESPDASGTTRLARRLIGPAFKPPRA